MENNLYLCLVLKRKDVSRIKTAEDDQAIFTTALAPPGGAVARRDSRLSLQCVCGLCLGHLYDNLVALSEYAMGGSPGRFAGRRFSSVQRTGRVVP